MGKSEQSVAQTQQNVVSAPHVLQAILQVKAHIAREGVGKNNKNKEQNYAFRGIDDVLNALAAPLVNAGLIVLPRVQSRSATEFTSKSGARGTSVELVTEYDLVSAVDGSSVPARMISEASDYADKATNKAVSFALKNLFITVFNIPIVGADEGDFESPGNEAEQPTQPRTFTGGSGGKEKPAKTEPEKPLASDEYKTLVKKIAAFGQNAARVADLITKNFAVKSIDDLPADKFAAAIERVDKFAAAQAADKAKKPAPAQEKPTTASDLPE